MDFGDQYLFSNPSVLGGPLGNNEAARRDRERMHMESIERFINDYRRKYGI